MSPLALAALLAAGWPQSRGDQANTAFVELTDARDTPQKSWSFETGKVLGYEPGMTVWSPPALGVVDGRATVFAGNYDHLIYALDALTGDVRWKYTTGDGVYSAPLLWSDGDKLTLFAASNDRAVYALDAASGRRLWSTPLEEYRPTLGGARLFAGCVGRVGAVDALFVGSWVADRSLSGTLQRGEVAALSARDGKVLWTTPLGDSEVTAPVCSGDRVFVGNGGGNLYALDAQRGEVQWKHTEHDGIRSAPAVAEVDGMPLVVTGSRYGLVRALDARDGAERWRFKTGDRITGSPAIARVGARLLVFVPSYDRRLYALDARTGEVAWRYEARAGFYSSPAFVPAPKPTVLALAWDHSLHGVDAETGAVRFTFFTGRPLWDVAGLDASTWSSPVATRLGGESVVFAGSYDGRLRAVPFEAPVAGNPKRRTALLFWLSFPATLVPLALAALWLTRRYRRATPQPLGREAKASPLPLGRGPG